MNPDELEGTLNWFANPLSQVSSHWVIGREGQKVRVVADDCMAWHAGEHNATHWGIELEQGVESDGFTQPQLDALTLVIQCYMQDYGIDAVHDFLGLVGHEETPQGEAIGKTDPGDYFPWDSFVAGLNPAAYRDFLAGDEAGGIEKRGKQLFIWNEWVETDAIGDYEGTLPGSHWHNAGGEWVKILD
jgi:N-acetyl-anhydromuramyl-L-alanine amidase AmpD